MDEKQRWKDEVLAVMNDYLEVFIKGTREDAQAFVKLPIAYIAESNVQMRERYPFDPVKLRQVTGLDHVNADMEVIHVDAQKAHVLLSATRHRADDSKIESLESIYILQNEGQGDGWKITAFSGIRTPAE